MGFYFDRKSTLRMTQKQWVLSKVIAQYCYNNVCRVEIIYEKRACSEFVPVHLTLIFCGFNRSWIFVCGKNLFDLAQISKYVFKKARHLVLKTYSLNLSYVNRTTFYNIQKIQYQLHKRNILVKYAVGHFTFYRSIHEFFNFQNDKLWL